VAGVRKVDRRANGGKIPAQHTELAVTETVTGPTTPEKERADSRSVDCVSNDHPPKGAKKGKAKRQPCIVPGVQRLYNVKEAASYLRLSPWTVRSLGWNGEIPEVKIGRRVLYDRNDLDEFVDRNKRRQG